MPDPRPFDLDPCRHCAGEGRPTGDGPGFLTVECLDCGARCGSVEAPDADTALPDLRRMWNRRPAPADPRGAAAEPNSETVAVPRTALLYWCDIWRTEVARTTEHSAILAEMRRLAEGA